MNKNSVKGALTALSMAMLLVACNSNDHDNPQPTNSNAVTLKTLTISPSLGKILKAKVVLKNAATNAPIGEQNTGSTGKVTFTIPSSVRTVIAEVQGGNGAQYFDEATGKMVDLPVGAVLRAATTVVANNSEIGVTALTEAAVKRAETLAGAGNNIVPHLNTAKAQIESAFDVADILKAPTLVGSQQELAALGSSPAEQYALRLATLAKVAQQQLGTTETAPALKVAQAIAEDLADGDIDGSGNTEVLPYDVATFASQYQAQALKLIQDFIASASQNGFDAAKLQTLLTFVQNNPVNFQLTPNNNATLKTLTISPSLGKILKAKVVLKNAANNAAIGEQNTGSTGKVTFTIPSTVSTVIAEVQGGNGAQYFDEATGKMVDLPVGAVLRAATTVVANNSEIGVTALTEAAVKRAETLANGGNIIPQLNAAKAQIESAFGVADILKAPTLVGSQQELAALGSSAAEQYALRLATLAKVAQQQLGATETAPALKLAQAIANDLADGDIDGSGNTGALPYDVATFANQYQAQALKLIQDFIASASQNGFDAVKLQALLTFVQSNPLNLNVTPPAIVFALTGFTPVTAQVGAEVTITGTGFNADKTKMSVQFANSVAAEIISATATNVVVKVPQGAVTGKLTVTNTALNQTVTSLAVFVLATSGNTTGCGQLPTLTFADLLPFTGSYAVEIKNNATDPSNPPTLVKAATLQLTAVNTTANSALVKLNGATANVLSVCQNGDSKNNVIVNLDKNNAHVDFNLLNQQKTTNGVDFSGAGEFFASKVTDTGGGGCTGTVTATPNANKDGINLSWPAVTGATSYRIYRTGKIGNTDIFGSLIPNQTVTNYSDTNRVYSGAVYQYEVLANGASCSFPKVSVEVGNPIAALPSFSSSQVSASFSSVVELVTGNNLLMVAGTPATAKSTDNGSTWTSAPIANINGSGVAFDVGTIASDGTTIVGANTFFFGKTTDGTWSTLATLPLTDLQPLPQGISGAPSVYYRAVKHIAGRWYVAGGYKATSPTVAGGVEKSFIASSTDLSNWKIDSFAYDGRFSQFAIVGDSAKVVVRIITDTNQVRSVNSTDNGSTWTDTQTDDVRGRMTLLAGKIYSSSGLGLYSSNDGITWQRVEEGTKPSQCSSMPTDITTINGLLYGFCDNRIVASGDGRAWGLVSADLGFRGRSLIRSSNRWIMAGGAGLIKIAD